MRKYDLVGARGLEPPTPEPHSGALAKLRYAPTLFGIQIYYTGAFLF